MDHFSWGGSGLDQAFNSLHAQREACEAFIRSQSSEGWVLVPQAYDDGGISGGTLERPALQRLLAEIREGRIDIVVVYKVDRLTRSLADFAKLVETFDAAGASFVSVTQAFNTSTSMGRLTLNMLLSFAQFEREVTAERIRDKIAASKKKGMWMGGPVPLGYDVKERRLVVNEDEAARVRHIYARYLALGSIRHLKAELDRDGIVSKSRLSRSGERHGGVRIVPGALRIILRNPLYIGEVQHKGERFPGQHEEILNRATWDAAQERLKRQRLQRRCTGDVRAASPLAGMLFDHEGRPLTPSHASKRPRRIRYRFYVSHALSAGLAVDHPGAWRLPAEPVERTVRNALADLLQRPDTMRDMEPESVSALQHKTCLARLGALRERIANSDGPTLRQLLTTLAARIEIGPDTLTLSISRAALMREIDPEVSRDEPDERLVSSLPLQVRKRGIETRLVLGELIAMTPDEGLVRLIADARSWARQLLAGEFSSLRALAATLQLDHRHVARALPFAFLAPDIVATILDGRQSDELTVTRLKELKAPPLRWGDQREVLSIERPA